MVRKGKVGSTEAWGVHPKSGTGTLTRACWMILALGREQQVFLAAGVIWIVSPMGPLPLQASDPAL